MVHCAALVGGEAIRRPGRALQPELGNGDCHGVGAVVGCMGLVGRRVYADAVVVRAGYGWGVSEDRLGAAAGDIQPRNVVRPHLGVFRRDRRIVRAVPARRGGLRSPNPLVPHRSPQRQGLARLRAALAHRQRVRSQVRQTRTHRHGDDAGAVVRDVGLTCCRVHADAIVIHAGGRRRRQAYGALTAARCREPVNLDRAYLGVSVRDPRIDGGVVGQRQRP